MSERDRINEFAIGLTVVLGIAVIYFVGWTFIELKTEQRISKHYSGQYEASDASRKIAEICASETGLAAVECVIEQTKGQQERANDTRDLNAQEWMAHWALWMFVVTSVMAFITAIGVWFVWRTLLATQQMARETREIGEAQVCAYLTFGGVSVTLIPGKRKLHKLTFSVAVKNSGHSPAKQVVIEIHPFEGMTLAQPEMRVEAHHTMILNDISPGEQIIAGTTITVTEDRMRWRVFGENDERFWVEASLTATLIDVFGNPDDEAATFIGWCQVDEETTLARNYDEFIEPKMWGAPEKA